MQGSVETRSASEAQPEKRPRGASRAVGRTVKPEGKSSRSNPGAGASRWSWDTYGASRMRLPDEPKDGFRCESEVGRRPCRRRVHSAQAGWNEDRQAQARWIAAGRQVTRNAGASQRGVPAEPKTRDRSEPEGWPPVELECRSPTQVGDRAPAQPEVTAPAKAGGRPLGEPEGTAPVALPSDQD